MNPNILHKVQCRLFGHRPIDTSDCNLCRCGARILPVNGSITRMRHVVSCFLSGHSYTRMGERNSHHEFACSICGHPLLIDSGRGDYAGRTSFEKKPRYRCSLFGHKVHKVVERDGFSEYACGCGHSFLKTNSALTEIKHPIICLVAGHFIRFATMRTPDQAEHACRNCGHTFYFPARALVSD